MQVSSNSSLGRRKRISRIRRRLSGVVRESSVTEVLLIERLLPLPMSAQRNNLRVIKSKLGYIECSNKSRIQLRDRGDRFNS